jgi:hypothetical protein
MRGQVMNWKTLLLLLLIAIFLFSFACAQLPQSAQNWQDIELRDIATDKSFQISDFKDKVIVIETMVMWCDACVRQQEEIAKARSSLAEEVVFITIDIDTDESESIIEQHMDRYGFDWIYVLASSELNYQLQSELGSAILSPPMSPIAIIDKEQGIHLMERGHKSAEELIAEISKYL